MRRLPHGTVLVIAALMALCFACASPASVSPTDSPVPTATEPPAEVESFALVATPAPTPAPTPEPTPTPEGYVAPSPTPAPETFSVVWIADTQVINELFPDTLLNMLGWTVRNRDEQNIRLVVHTGDIINDVNSRRQWNNAAAAFASLEGEIPFLAVAGNHDVGTGTIDYTEFNKNIAKYYTEPSREFEGGRGYYQLIDTPTDRFLFVGIGWAYKSAAVQYLNRVLAEYPDRIAVLSVHSYLNENTKLTDGGDILFEKVVKPNRNVRFVLCGHRDNTAHLATPIDDDGDGSPDRTVHQMLYNYQELKKDEGGGYLRILAFDCGARSLSVTTYSPPLDHTLSDGDATFLIANAF